jgi:hypothetical protein
MEEKKQTMCAGLGNSIYLCLFYIFLRGRRHVNHHFFKKKLQYMICRQSAKNPLTTMVAEKLL